MRLNKLRHILPGWIDPAAAFVTLYGTDTNVAWLDSGEEASTGKSYMGRAARHITAVSQNGATVLEQLRAELDAVRIEPDDETFSLGWVGWLGYEDAASRAGAPASEAEPGIPQQFWLRADTFVAFDHAARRVWALAAGSEAAAALADDIAAARPGAPAPPAPSPVAVTARHTPDEYAALIERCRDAIREGDADN